ncbi:hydroxyacid dehydrogenase [Phytoactinopolyspora alkaliphila]|uniref:Hydroxyacid dehydrogenase n=1 Tax=Phytoactinopolyspora alkaliphila TaxID=1783498 RepID=A0A6N9YKL3_9ACTN|nr:hydroxyacid dehydrogenase [Phytoactinopolyspora alkaliphila]
MHVGPGAPDELVSAVEEAGGKIVPPEDASALIWFTGGPGEAAPYLHEGIRWVQLPGAGVESWFASGLLTPGRTYTSAVGIYAPSVAEHALALMLAGARRLHELASVRTWTRPDPTGLGGSTVAVVGSGGIGQELIRLLEPFRVRILAITRSGRTVPGAAVSTTPDRLVDVLKEADFVVVAAPSTDETRALIGEPELAAMRETAWLINIARGALIDTDALVEALVARTIGGAALDVTDPEPLPDGHPLWGAPNALITPHSANPLKLRLPRYVERVRRNVENYIEGRPLEGVVDIDAGY